MRPPSIVRFEQLYAAYWLVGIVNTVLGWGRMATAMRNPSVAALGPGFLYAATAIGLLIPVLLWYFIARRGSIVAKWILVVLFAIGVVGLTLAAMRGSIPGGIGGILAGVALVLQAAAIVMLFRPDARLWFGEDVGDSVDEEAAA